MWTLGERVAALIQHRASKLDIRGLKRKHGLIGDRLMRLEIFDDSGHDREGKQFRQFLFMLTDGGVEKYEWESVKGNPMVEPTIHVRLGAYAAVAVMRRKAAPMTLRNQGVLSWRYLKEHPMNHLHTDMKLLVNVLNDIRDAL